MTCREFVEFLHAWLFDDLAPDERAEFDRHLAVCESCVNYLEGYRRSIRLVRSALKPDNGSVPKDVPEELVQAILAARDKTGG